ncbi:hypothetical protein F5Y03DRAFT_389450 [Xylaria venustula]|nr:hypothetical protein F5Y03DRAFT_389450 [Xylaria venustula]
MDGAPDSDKSLLERLNALKPSTVSLTTPSSDSNPISTIERDKPPSREDALTARLKSLRNQSAVPFDSAATDHDRDGAGESTQPRPATQTETPAESKSGIQQAPTSNQITEDGDPLLYTDDQTLEELLEELRSDETWLDEVAAEEEEHQRVTTLLTELNKSSDVSRMPDSQETPQENGEDSSDDNSEGDFMTAEIDSALAKVMDEVEWEKANEDPSPPTPTPPKDAEKASQHTTVSSPKEDTFNLPTVPSELQDQPGLPTSSSTQDESDVDFAASIASRMAALKLSGSRNLPSAPTAVVDSLGLPQAPTFAPADRPVPGLAKRAGLTDEDQKTWCVVCLEDGTIRCLGCEEDDNVYCARCWKEMHVGPQAGYDERGHSWETFSETVGSADETTNAGRRLRRLLPTRARVDDWRARCSEQARKLTRKVKLLFWRLKDRRRRSRIMDRAVLKEDREVDARAFIYAAKMKPLPIQFLPTIREETEEY